MSLADTIPCLSEETAPDTRSRILATADAYFREIGYQKTTVADIARALKMSPANVYRFFDSKKAINEAVLERLIGEVEALISEIADRPGLDPTERLVAAIETLHRDCTRRCEAFPRVHEMIEAAMAESWDVCRHHVARITAGFERIIRDGVARGVFEAADPAEAAACVHAAIARYTHPVLVGKSPLQPAPSVEAMTAFLLRSLAPRGPRP
ncbi:DNA-binding transcriptional regulator, AcrR family [Methylobacterium phyllostachyos]|uniref:DNA-binding transcriptional regulator, AcrR family n=1 Tax=Methylobacterium phyllostachyos TaxID=582672 RepID=A0A1H0BG41_9HYPH|nr:TetR/AcrR family transcriptional regulator [Methylobacterium phyllostachyos]SDN44363.1 DNA-binding transcriptional regulator, AcrR family [Methylobacterium phyllostachyos]